MYADKITGSMRRALDETERRRNKQIAHNKEHGITPKSIQRKVADIMEGAYGGSHGSARQYAKVAEEIAEYATLSSKELEKKVRQLEQRMYEHAQNLEFEEAAHLRDEVKKIQEAGMGLVQGSVV